MVNGMSCTLMLDTGATMSAVPGRSPGQYTGNQVQVTLADLSVIQMHVASVNIEIEGKSQ